MALNIKQVPSPNHYNGRNGHRVTHITLHIMVGRLAGTDAIFQRPSSQASAHYGIGGTGERSQRLIFRREFFEQQQHHQHRA